MHQGGGDGEPLVCPLPALSTGGGGRGLALPALLPAVPAGGLPDPVHASIAYC